MVCVSAGQYNYVIAYAFLDVHAFFQRMCVPHIDARAEPLVQTDIIIDLPSVLTAELCTRGQWLFSTLLDLNKLIIVVGSINGASTGT